MAHHTGSFVIRLADCLRDAAARHGRDRLVIPLTALATGVLLASTANGETRGPRRAKHQDRDGQQHYQAADRLGAPPALGSDFLRRLADPDHTHETGAVWRAAAVDHPHLSGSLRPLIGWLSDRAPAHDVKALAECFGVLTVLDLMAAAESSGVGGDLLGPVYSLLRGGHSRQRAGAFYTPPDLSALLAGITEVRPGDRVYEPACGTGGMVLAAVRSMRRRGLDPNSCTWTLNDLDPLAVALAAVNLTAHGVRTVQLRCGDALMQPAEATGHDQSSVALAGPQMDPT